MATFEISSVTEDEVLSLLPGRIGLTFSMTCGYAGYVVTGDILPPIFSVESAQITSRRTCLVTFSAPFAEDTVSSVTDWSILPAAGTIGLPFHITSVNVMSSTTVLLAVDLPGFLTNCAYTITAISAEARFL